VVRHGRLGEVEQRHQLAHAHLAGVLSEHIDELQPHGITERLGNLGHPDPLITLDVGIHDRLAATLPRGPLRLRSQFQIDSHLYTNTD